MIRKSTFILLIVFVLLGGVALVLQQGWLENSQEEEPTPTTQPGLLDNLPQDTLMTIQVLENDQVTLELTKSSAGTWGFTNPQTMVVDPSKVEQLVSALYSLTPTSIVSATNPLESLGISPGGRQIILVDTSLSQTTLHLGSLTPTSSGYFLQVDNNPAIVVSKYGIQDIQELIQPAALQMPTPTPTPAP